MNRTGSLGALAILPALVGIAHADDGPAPDAGLFGLDQPEAPAAAASCAAIDEFACVFALSASGVGPALWRSVLVADDRFGLPVGAADHDAIVDHAFGAASGAASGADGPIIAGAGPRQHRWLIEGAPADDVARGGVGTRVPLAFVDQVAVAAGGFAPGMASGSGAIIDVRLRRGGPRTEVRTWAWTELDQIAVDGAPDQSTRPELIVDGERNAVVHSLALTAGGPIGAHGWYFAGIAPRLRDVAQRRRAWRLVDADQDALPDRQDGIVTRAAIADRTLPSVGLELPVIARVGATLDEHEVTLTLVGGWRNDTVEPTLLGSASATRIDRSRIDGDAIAWWHRRWQHTEAEAQLAWHHAAHRERGHVEGSDDDLQLRTGYIPRPADAGFDDYAVLAACDDFAASDPAPVMTQCPISGQYRRGGPGLLIDDTGDRPSARVEVARVLDQHRLAVGASGDWARLERRSRYSGGALRTLDFEARRTDQRLVALGGGDDACGPADAPVPCTYLDEATTTWRSRTLAAWIEDGWRPRPDLAITAGLRWDGSKLGAVSLDRQLGPRLAIAWDHRGDGSSRLFAGYSRLHAPLPAGLGARAIGGPTRLTVIEVPEGDRYALDDGAVAIDPDLDGVAIDDLVAGEELVVVGAVRIGAVVQLRRLASTLDTVDGVLANPADAWRHDAIATTYLSTAPSARTRVRIGYSFHRARGTWTLDDEAPFAGAAFDDADTSANLDGRLPADRGHVGFAELGGHRGVFGLDLELSGRFTVASGAPRTVTGPDGELLLPRGEGRTPHTSRADLHAALTGGRFAATLDVLDAFASRVATAIDSRYSDDLAHPIVGGDQADLLFLKADDSDRPVRRNPDFGRTTAVAPPLTIIVGARATW